MDEELEPMDADGGMDMDNGSAEVDEEDDEFLPEPADEDGDMDVDMDDLPENFDLEEVLKALQEEEEEDDKEEEEEEMDEITSLKAELGEHREVVKYLRSKLNEVNLLNAKLLFTNKLFRNHSMTNEQKIKVIEQFDRAKTLREVKLVFSTIAESMGSKHKKSVNESKKGSASKVVASTKPKKEESNDVLSEGAELKARFQKLAKIL